MFTLNFKDKYKIVHICNELGKNIIGGAGTYLNEIYRYRHNDMGFLYVDFDYNQPEIINKGFTEKNDIAVIYPDEADKLETINCDIVVIHFYELYFCLRDEFLKNKRIAYVIHSVPTPEPMPEADPFGGNEDVQNKFQFICDLADVLICVSNAEKTKLINIFPQYKKKINVVYNGMTFNNRIYKNTNYRNSRRVLGYIGRIDSRKGIIETITAIKHQNAELLIAGLINDENYFRIIKSYVDGAQMWDRVKFLGWCSDERKKEFFRRIDALVIPSMYEPFGYVALEAMEHLVPVLSSDNGGLDEILKNYRYKYNPYSETGFCECLKCFQEDSADIIEQQINILKSNRNRFYAEQMSDNYYKIWEEMSNSV